MTRSTKFGLAAAAALALLAAGTARAQVLSIGDDGAVTTYDAPGVFTDAGVEAIAPDQVSHPTDVALLIREASARHGVDARLAEAVAWQESRFNQAAVSPRGARGVMQLMPGTASGLGVDAGDLRGNIEGGVSYLAQQLRRFGDVRLALAAYNAGPGAVTRYGGVPPFSETQTYIRAILTRMAPAALAPGALSE